MSPNLETSDQHCSAARKDYSYDMHDTLSESGCVNQLGTVLIAIVCNPSYTFIWNIGHYSLNTIILYILVHDYTRLGIAKIAKTAT